jgi:nitric oxide reductase NorD protein
MDTLSVTQDGERVAAKVRFDLDLPSAGEDDLMLGEGILLPEWDYRENRLRTAYCCVQPMLARSAEPCALPPHLRRTARRLRNQLAVLAPQRRWLKGQPEGSELDLDACVRAEAERMAGVNRDGAGATGAGSGLSDSRRPFAVHRCLGRRRQQGHRRDPRQPDAACRSAAGDG